MLMAKQLRGDSIALTEGLLIAGWWLLGDGLALSGASRQLSQRESLWQAGQAHAGRAKFDFIVNNSALL